MYEKSDVLSVASQEIREATKITDYVGDFNLLCSALERGEEIPYSQTYLRLRAVLSDQITVFLHYPVKKTGDDSFRVEESLTVLVFNLKWGNDIEPYRALLRCPLKGVAERSEGSVRSFARREALKALRGLIWGDTSHVRLSAQTLDGREAETDPAGLLMFLSPSLLKELENVEEEPLMAPPAGFFVRLYEEKGGAQ